MGKHAEPICFKTLVNLTKNSTDFAVASGVKDCEEVSFESKICPKQILKEIPMINQYQFLLRFRRRLMMNPTQNPAKISRNAPLHPFHLALEVRGYSDHTKKFREINSLVSRFFSKNVDLT